MHLRRNSRPSLRRSVALTLGGIALTAPLLTSCGFNYATDRVYTPASGVNNRDASVDVLGAVIVAKQDNEGTFIATFSNNSTTKKNTVESLAGAGGNTIQVESFSPVKLDPGGLANLATDGGFHVSGSFSLGDFVPVTVTFGSGERVELDVPVVTDSGDYAGLDTSSVTATPSESPSDTASESSESPSASPSE